MTTKWDPENAFAKKCPAALDEWCWDLNGSLSPHTLSAGSSSKKFYLKCIRNEEHVPWKTSAHQRANATIGCPQCSGRVATSETCIATRAPHLVAEWHHELNLASGRTPDNTAAQSNHLCFWKCKDFGDRHIWTQPPNARVFHKTGCVYCSGHRVCEENCLATKRPEIAAQWCYERNDDLKPTNCTEFSEKKVWWVCPKEPTAHIWQANISSRSSGHGCPYCVGQKVSSETCLVAIYPGIAAEWHPTKNGDMTPHNTMPGSDKKAWFVCSVNSEHEWFARIAHRTANGRGCPYCQSSRGSRRVEQYLKDNGFKYLPEHRFKEEASMRRCPFDFYLPEQNIAIEYDGQGHFLNSTWYEGKGRAGHTKEDFERIAAIDARKSQYCKDKGICLIRIPYTHFDKIEDILATHITEQPTGTEYLYDVPAVSKPRVVYMPERTRDSLLINKNPAAALQWDHSKNANIDLSTISCYGTEKVWWKCAEGHEYSATPTAVAGAKENYCKTCKSLAYKHPDIAAEWHPEKNGDLLPTHLTASNAQSVWWQCSANKDHEWKVRVADRTQGKGCPFCAGKQVNHTNSLQVMFPELAAEFITNKNNKGIDQLSRGSHYKAWWQCPLNIEHQYIMETKDRVAGKNCPYCAGKRVNDTNSLAALRPDLIEEWHPDRNGDLTAQAVSLHSGKSIWWKCKVGHEWEASICNRTREDGTNCPSCK